MTFLLANWKAVLIAVLLSIIAYGVIDYLGQRQQIDGLTKQLKNRDDRILELVKDDKEKTSKLKAYEQAAIDLRKSHQEAQNRRLQVINSLSKQISTIRNQPVPKDCQKAIEFAIEHKDDLKW